MKIKTLVLKIKALGRTIIARTLGLTTSAYSNNSDTSTTRIMYVANAFIPTLQLSFVKPLSPLVESGEISTELISEQQMKELFGKQLRDSTVHRWIDARLAAFRPTVIVFCRYSGPHAEYIIEQASGKNIPTILHIDDDLLNVPVEIGQKKYEYHNHPLRLAMVEHLLNNVSLIYSSTEALKQRFQSYGYNNEIQVGQIYCSGEVLIPAINRPVKKIGYMGFDHAHDFELVLPAIIQLLRRYPQIEFELFGSIPKPASLDEFGSRVKLIPPVPEYGAFMAKFSTLNWDIGLCPLALTSFNTVKANTKWVEYTSVGAAVVASSGSVYDSCCADNRGMLINTTEDWFNALEKLVLDNHHRFDLVSKAQVRLMQDYSVASLREQVLSVLHRANEIEAHRR